MLVLNKDYLETSSADDFLYSQFIRLLEQIKIAQGGTSLDSTLKRHPKVRKYLISKQANILNDLESTYFTEEGLLDSYAIQSRNNKQKSRQIY